MRRLLFLSVLAASLLANYAATALAFLSPNEVIASNGDQVEVIGPPNGADTTIKATLFAGASGNYAAWTATGSVNGLFQLNTCQSIFPGPCGNGPPYTTQDYFIVSTPEVLNVGTSFTIFYAPNVGFPNATGSATIDLQILGGSDFSFSVPAVPEPSTWAMMILGFAAIGAFTYRTRIAALTSAQ